MFLVEPAHKHKVVEKKQSFCEIYHVNVSH
jgi:hypothetical protein